MTGITPDFRKWVVRHAGTISVLVILPPFLAFVFLTVRLFSSLELLVAESLGAALAGAFVSRYLHSFEGGKADVVFPVDLGAVSLVFIFLSWIGVWTSTWYLAPFYHAMIVCAVVTLVTRLIFGKFRQNHDSHILLGVLILLALTLKSALYAANFYPWIGDGGAHVGWTYLIAAEGHVDPGTGIYVVYSGYHLLMSQAVILSGLPGTYFPFLPFLVTSLVPLPVYLAGKRLSGERVGLMAALIVTIMYSTNLSWQPAITAVIFGAIFMWGLMKLDDPGLTNKSALVLTLFIIFGAALQTYPVSAFACFVLALVDTAWNLWARRRLILIGAVTSVALFAQTIFASTSLFVSFVDALFGREAVPLELPTVQVTHYLTVTPQFVMQYLFNLEPFAFGIFFVSLATFPLIRRGMRHVEYISIGGCLAILASPFLQFATSTGITNLTEVSYFYPFAAPAAAVGVMLLARSPTRKRAWKAFAIVIVTLTIVSLTISSSTANDPNLYLFKDSTGFSPIYANTATFRAGYFTDNFSHDFVVYSDPSTSAYMFKGRLPYFPGIREASFNTSIIQPFSFPGRGYVIVNTPVMERFFSSGEDSFIPILNSHLQNKSDRVYDIQDIQMYLNY